MKGRFLSLVLVIAVGYSFLFFRLYNIQISKGGYYLAKAESQYAASGIVSAKRGTIYFSDKNGNKIAVALENDFPVIFAAPKMIDDAKETYNRLLEIIPDMSQSLENKLSSKTGDYLLIERKADEQTVGKVQNENIKGVFTASEPERNYPFLSLASQLIGFVGPNSDDNGESGKYGLEKFYEEELNGVPGKTDGGKIVGPQDGQDIILTVDQNIQKQAEGILKNLVVTSKSKSGTFIVEEPSTGKILAMGGYPDFDPNDYSGSPLGDFLNQNVQAVYEPGSVVKVLTMAAGIETGKITPNTTYVDKGQVVISGKKIENSDFKTHGPHGLITMTNVIENSLNTGAVFAESKIGNDVFRDYLVKFGLRDRTGVDLPGEVSGNLRALFTKYVAQVNYSTASFGQGIAVTPLELVTAVGTIANGGKMMRPYVNSALGPKPLGTVVSSSTASQVIGMMISAVDKAGVAKLSGYSIAGKTGTAYIADAKTKKYTDKVTNTYVGFGPASSPRFIALVKLEDPEGAPVAALTVVPAFRDLAQFILNYYNVPPDRL